LNPQPKKKARITDIYFKPQAHSRRNFHSSFRYEAIKPFLLADIGEGITECEVIQW
jgi:hypothetical protein